VNHQQTAGIVAVIFFVAAVPLVLSDLGFWHAGTIRGAPAE
jgi:hypothetical protein